MIDVTNDDSGSVQPDFWQAHCCVQGGELGRYSVVYADPAWDYGKMKERKKAHRGGNPQSHYKTMSVEEICKMPVADLADENSCLFLWVTNPKMQLGFDVMKAWGFKYQTIITWVKIDNSNKVIKNGIGFYFRGATEHILFGTKGSFKIPTDKRIPNVIMAKRNAHSSKPVEAYNLIENVTDGKRIELFARNKRDGWDCWGNQIKSEGLLF